MITYKRIDLLTELYDQKYGKQEPKVNKTNAPVHVDNDESMADFFLGSFDPDPDFWDYSI